MLVISYKTLIHNMIGAILDSVALQVIKMRASEIISERRKKRRPRYAAYGPGPYGGYGYYAGYSGDSSGGGDGGGGESINHEASYPGNIGMMELAKFFSMADEEQKTLFKQLLERGKKGLAWKLVQDIVGVKLQGSEFNEDAMMGKIEDGGKIVRILKKQHTVPFSDEKNWLLIDTDPAKGNKGLGLKWVPASTRFTWVRPYKETVDENFADGKKPGRKGLAKRSGVNTKASVSSLRKTAKNSSGEKQRMAHWLANMKAGRAKKNK